MGVGETQAQVKKLPMSPGLESWGPPLQYHEPWMLPEGMRVWVPRLAFALLALAPVFFIPEAYFALKQGREFNPILSGLAVGCLVLGIILLFTFGGNSLPGLSGLTGRRVYYVYPEALVVGEAGAAKILRWDDIAEYYGAITVGGVHKVVTRDGEEVPLDKGVRDFHLLYLKVEAEATRVLLPKVREAIAKGETVEFGPLALDRAALHYKKKSVPWEDVAHVVLVINLGNGSRRLVVRTRGNRLIPWCNQDLNVTPNRTVFESIFTEICPVRLLKEEKKGT